MFVNTKDIQTSEKGIRYTHIETDSKAICFMFSGPSYNYDKPLFYYATMTMLENKIDIVHIHYSYEKHILKQPLEEITKIMHHLINVTFRNWIFMLIVVWDSKEMYLSRRCSIVTEKLIVKERKYR